MKTTTRKTTTKKTAAKKPAAKKTAARTAAKPAAKKASVKPAATAKGDGDDFTVKIGSTEVNLTNQGKLYFPQDKITKGDVVMYYQSVQQYILPYLKDRPQSLKRNPNGIVDDGFYHKDAGDTAPKWVKSLSLFSESANKDIDYIICNDRQTLMYLNNLGCIELNPWNSRKGKLDHPDYMVMDLDPSDKNTFEQVIEAAQAVKEVMDRAGAECYCKTSGATGLHIYVPMGARYTYEQVRNFAHITALLVQDMLPDTTTVERALKKRNKKHLYLDYLQNKRGQTLAAAYSLRPRKGATVSTPLDWKEVKKGLSPLDFTIQNTLKRIEKKGDLFAGVMGKGIDLKKVLKNLGE